MPTLIIVNGFSASGKSTTAQAFAEKHGFVLIKQDTFLFELNPIKESKKSHTKEDYLLTISNMMCCLKNSMKVKRNIIMEGALVSISELDPIDLIKFIALAKTNKYKVKVVTFSASDKVRYSRMKRKRHTLKKKLDELLKGANEDIGRKIKGIKCVDTSKLSRKKALIEFEKIILKK
jgi:dephospho-CoA kinase